jgi:hypothetical protein
METTDGYLHPHLHRDVISPDGTRYKADSESDLLSALTECHGPATVQIILIHRRTDGSDGAVEVIREYKV